MVLGEGGERGKRKREERKNVTDTGEALGSTRARLHGCDVPRKHNEAARPNAAAKGKYWMPPPSVPSRARPQLSTPSIAFSARGLSKGMEAGRNRGKWGWGSN